MINLFISYSHKDESSIGDFIEYMNPLTSGDNPFMKVWYDRQLSPGCNLLKEIDKRIDESNVICLFISPAYLASLSCENEVRRALELRKEKGLLVVPIILTTCRWSDKYNELGDLLAVPTDAKPIDTFENINLAWNDVYEQLYRVIECYDRTRNLKVSHSFESFLNDATILTKAHSEKNILTLDDVYVYQELTSLDKRGHECKTTLLKELGNFIAGSKYTFCGDDQSGKTSLLKKSFKVLKDKCFIPIYVRDPQVLLQGNLRHRVEMNFKEQYGEALDINDYDTNRVVVLIDDFHKAKNKEKILEEVQDYNSCILVVDDIFRLDVKNEQSVVDFKSYTIRELKASLRNELIRKWLSIREAGKNNAFSNEELARIDEMTGLVEQSLGKVLGNGIMPAHPFFILYVLSTYDFELSPSDNPNITSQGHCYQALIYFFLRSHGVDNDCIDAYLNFFTEFAKAIYDNKGLSLDVDTYEDFLKKYGQNYNYVEARQDFLNKVYASGIISGDSFNNYSFCYPYLYYFFAGKYFSDHWNDSDSAEHEVVVGEVKTILENLQKTSNAYIAIFIAHHTKSAAFLNYIIQVANCIYSKSVVATLDATCLAVFNKQSCEFVVPSLSIANNVEANRQRALEIQDEIEEKDCFNEDEIEDDAEEDFSKELRRSAKTVEVIGAILKNRAGSLRNEQLINLFETGMDVHLRQMTNFLDLIERIVETPNYSDFLVDRIKDKYKGFSDVQLREKANRLFWLLNSGFIFGCIRKIAKSLGSSKLIKIISDVCDSRNTPSAFMIKHTILMWNKKNLKIEELKDMDKVLTTPVSRNVMLWIVTDYCMMHRINYRDVPVLKELGIQSRLLLPRSDKD